MEKESERVDVLALMNRTYSMVRPLRIVSYELSLMRSFHAEEAVDQINARALQVVDRVQQKLTGRDFKPTVSLAVNEQVDKLIASATMVENLAVMFVGWHVFSSTISATRKANVWVVQVFFLVTYGKKSCWGSSLFTLSLCWRRCSVARIGGRRMDFVGGRSFG